MKYLAAFAVFILLLPLWLGILFEVWSFARRNQVAWLEAAAAAVGIVVDIAANYLHFRLLGPYPWKGKTWLGRTVTARINTMVRQLPLTGPLTHRQKFALTLARYLNTRDPGHVPSLSSATATSTN